MKLKEIAPILYTDEMWLCNNNNHMDFVWFEGDLTETFNRFGDCDVIRIVPTGHCIEVYINIGYNVRLVDLVYSDYCTAYFIEESNEVCIYDEIAEDELHRIRVLNHRDAERTINEWIKYAPCGIIAESISH